MLQSVGSEPFSVLCALCDPKKPVEMKYDELIATLTSNYTTPDIIFRERYNFYAATKDVNESVNQWYAKVKKLAMSCKFTAYDKIVWDKFVVGFAHHDKIFERLCEEKADLKVCDVLNKALTLETKFKGNNGHTVNFVKNRHRNKNHSGQAKGNDSNNNNTTNNTSSGNTCNSDQSKGKAACKHCGWTNHNSPLCKFKDHTCNSCGKKGHLANICRNKIDKNNNFSKSNFKKSNIVDHINSNNFDNNSFQQRSQSSGASLSMYMVNSEHASDTSVNGVSFQAKCDTGSPVSLMSIDVFDGYFDRNLLRPCSETFSDCINYLD